MTPEGLTSVMVKGKKGRIQYYRQYVTSFYVDEVKHLSEAISGDPAGVTFDRLIYYHPYQKSTEKPKRSNFLNDSWKKEWLRSKEQMKQYSAAVHVYLVY